MILHRITLENVGVFRGSHSIDLAPPDPEHPVILIGALNGGGKTTLLGALQLALYGSRAHGIERTKKGYLRHLEELINREAGPEADAVVEVELERRIDGQPVRYAVRRSWRMVEGQVKECLEASRNGEPDAVLSAEWDESIDSFLPARLAHLFFFDGEQIEKMADEEEATKVLSTAFQSLLGLDLVTRLQEDLQTLERRKRISIRSPEDREKLLGLQLELEMADKGKHDALDSLRSVETKVAQKENLLAKEKEKFKAKGGDRFQERDQLERERKDFADQLDSKESELRDMLAGSAPLLLIPDLLEKLGQQAVLETRAKHESIIAEAEEERDQKVLAAIQKALPGEAYQTVQRVLESTRPERSHLETPMILNADEDFPDQIQSLLKLALPQVGKELQRLETQIQRLREEIEKRDRSLASVPDEEALAKLQGEIARMERELVKLQEEIREKKEALQTAQFDLTLRQRAHEKEMRKHVDQWEGGAHDQRIVERVPKVQQTLEAFRKAVISRHVGSLEHAIYESFQHLIRKPELLASIQICPETLQLTIRDSQDRSLPFQILSAGERQLLATAILWGLAKVSGRPVPMVIDTPLGRLDSYHRSHIVQRYFPHASHQVILLSTDEEIVGKYEEALRPSIGKAYTLAFDSSQRSSAISNNYFKI
jgi:DNA sulfur modification protein DndD